MRIGFVGLGKLGLPCALAIESKGHEVMGYDISPDVINTIRRKSIPYKEIYAQEYLEKSKIKVGTLSQVTEFAEIIFVAVQTPHEERYEGVTRLPEERVDFDYSHLRKAIRDTSREIEKTNEDMVVIIISTVLPGTIRRDIKPLLGKHSKLCYNPFFIAMGTTITDFLNPEFVLFGVDDPWAAEKAEMFYHTLHNKPFMKMSVESAELAKVAYNTYITSKIVIANTLMEIAHKMPNVNVDDVTSTLQMATERIVSPKYMQGGMGDGGGCHPRDCIALSWLARKINLSHDIYEDLMKAREDQTSWLADLIEENNPDNFPIVILGKSFKPETNLTVGSPSILLANILKERKLPFVMYDPYVDGEPPNFSKSLFFIGTKHSCWTELNFPKGSIVIDPWRYIPDQEGVKIIRVGGKD